MERLEQKTLLSKDYYLNFREPPKNNQKKLVESSLRMIKNKVFDSDYNSTHIEIPKQSRDIQITLKELHNISENSLRLQKAKFQTKNRSISFQDSNHHQQSINNGYNFDQNQNIQDKNMKQDNNDFYNVQQFFSHQDGKQNQKQSECNYILNHQEFNFLFNQLNREKNGVIREKILNLESKKPDFMICQTQQTENIKPRLLQIQESVVKYSSVDQSHKSNIQKKLVQPRDYSPFMNVTKNIMMTYQQDNALNKLIQNTNAHSYMKIYQIKQDSNPLNTDLKYSDSNQLSLHNRHKSHINNQTKNQSFDYQVKEQRQKLTDIKEI
ncbi:hypothetical protein ABPG74_007071 [Tetrahymena malaccensis]